MLNIHDKQLSLSLQLVWDTAKNFRLERYEFYPKSSLDRVDVEKVP